MRLIAAMGVVSLVLACAQTGPSAPASLSADQFADLMVQQCIEGGRTQVITVDVGSAGGVAISLLSLDAKGNLKGEFSLNAASTEELTDRINSAPNQVDEAQAEKVRVCLQPVRDRLFSSQQPTWWGLEVPPPVSASRVPAYSPESPSAPTIAPFEKLLVPVREYLRSADIPSVAANFGAYGIMAFRAKPTSVTRDRLKMACASFIAYLARRAEVPNSVPLSDQMLTIWPLDEPYADEAKKDNCDFLVDHYELYAADSAISDASKQGGKFGSDGPFLIGWSPSNTRGVPDKLVLVVDMSSYSSQDSFNQALRFWKEKIVEDPALWRSGFSLEKFRLSVRDFVDHYGETILAAAHLSKV